MFDWLMDGIDGLMQTIGDYFLYNFIFKVFYYLEIALCYVLSWLEEVYKTFTGMSDVTYDGSQMSLFNVFMQNKAVNGVFLGMAAIGIVFAFISAIIQVTRKALDIDDKVKPSHGQILGNLFRCILIIISMNLSVTIVVTFLDTLMDSLDYTFDNSYELGKGPSEHYFTNEEFAAMGRIFNTIGNYSLNPSYKNRYSINACYNEIRSDLQYLSNRKVFTFYYETLDEDGNVVPTWQSVISNIANAADYTVEQPVDVYNEGIANALSDAMTIIKSDANIEALDYYHRLSYKADEDIGFDRIVFVSATMGFARTAGAKNDQYNIRPSMDDAVRDPYYRGAKDIYNIDQVNQDFDISIFKTNYLVAYILTILLIYNMGLIILTAVARIFNMIFLYVISPPIIGLMPLDDGGKFKQWMTAFIVQAFSIFATIISMRLYLIFVPIILSPSFVFHENVLFDMIGKLLLLYGGMEAVGKANGILTGILADQAGMQSIQAGDMKGSLGKLAGGVAAAAAGAWSMGKSAVGAVASGAKGAGGAASSLAGKGLEAMTGSGDSGGAGGSGGAGSDLPENARGENKSDSKNLPEAKNGSKGPNSPGAGNKQGGAGGTKTPPPKRSGSGKSTPDSQRGLGEKTAGEKAADILKSAPGAVGGALDSAAEAGKDAVEGAGSFIADSFRFVSGDSWPQGSGSGSSSSEQKELDDRDEEEDENLPDSLGQDFDGESDGAGEGDAGGGNDAPPAAGSAPPPPAAGAGNAGGTRTAPPPPAAGAGNAGSTRTAPPSAAGAGNAGGTGSAPPPSAAGAGNAGSTGSVPPPSAAGTGDAGSTRTTPPAGSAGSRGSAPPPSAAGTGNAGGTGSAPPPDSQRSQGSEQSNIGDIAGDRGGSDTLEDIDTSHSINGDDEDDYD